MADEIAKADSELIQTGDLENLVEQFAERSALNAPTLIEGAVSISPEDRQVDIIGDFRFGSFGPGPNYIAGIRVRYYVPFSGDREMFRCAGNIRYLSLPPIELRDNELEFAYERPDQDVAATKAEFDKELSQVREALGSLRRDCQAFSASLPAQAREKIAARREQLAEFTKGIHSLGVPIRSPGEARQVGPQRAAPSKARPTTRDSSAAERYDIALSFAGENRPYVEEVAAGLKSAGVSVFYDRYETANLWGKNLIDHLADIYSKNSRYVVMFISKEYVNKVWTSHERRHAQDRALVAQEEYILPARFDDTPVPGMTTTVGFQDLRHTTPGELVKIVLAKLHRD